MELNWYSLNVVNKTIKNTLQIHNSEQRYQRTGTV